MMKKDLYHLRKTGWVWAVLLLGSVLLQGCASIKSYSDFEHGTDLFKNQQYYAAHEYALDAHMQDPQNLKYAALLGWTWLKQGNTQEAEAQFTFILKTEPDNISGLQGMAWVSYDKKEFEKAQRLFEKDIAWAQKHIQNDSWQYYPPNDRLYVQSILSDGCYGLGLIGVALHKYSIAADEFQKALKYQNSFIGTTPIKTALADNYYSQKDYGLAGEVYLELLQSNLNNPSAFNGLLWCIQMSGDNLGAEKVFSAGIKDAKDQRRFLFGMMVVSRLRNDKQEMERFFLRLIQLDPEYVDKVVPEGVKDPDFWKKLIADYAKPMGEAYFEHGDFENALRHTQAYLRRSPGDSEALITEAWSRLYFGRYQDSLSEFTRLTQQPGIPKDQSLIGKGVSLLYLERLDEADKAGRVFHNVAQKYPENVRARMALGAVAYLRGDFKEAIRIYTSNLEFLPKKDSFFSWPSHALNNLGWSYYYSGDYANALGIFQKLETYHPRPFYPVIYNGLGWSNLRLNHVAESRQAFRESLSIDPENGSALAGLASLAKEK